MEIIDARIDEIFNDEEFNCRGHIAPHEVADLAQDIRSQGLLFPICIQPISDSGKAPINPTTGNPYKWRCVAGHRRLTACKVLQWEKIQAFIKEGLDEVSARLMNFGENLQRKELNILQEAQAIEGLIAAGLGRGRIAKALHMSDGWVQARSDLLRLPEAIQQEAVAGIITQYQIKQIAGLATDEEKYEAVRKIKEAKARGEKGIKVGNVKPKTTATKKHRDREEIFRMIEFLAEHTGMGLHTRCLSWAAGEIETAKLFESVKEVNPDFHPPLEW